MATLKHHCNNCDAEFRLVYDTETTESNPIYCPFCAEYILSDMDEDLDDDMET